MRPRYRCVKRLTCATVNDMRKDLDELRREAVRLLQQYSRAGEGDQTPIVRDLARVLVEARGLFTQADGRPDWGGRSYAYRHWVGELYLAAGFGGRGRTSIQSRIRYHIGTVTREVLDDKTLEEYGLLTETPKERSLTRRRRSPAAVQAFRARDAAGGALLAITAADSLLSEIKIEDLETLDAKGADVARAALTDIEHTVWRLAKLIPRSAPTAGPLEFRQPEASPTPE